MYAAIWSAIAILAGGLFGSFYYFSARLDTGLARLESKMDQGFAQVDARFDSLISRMDARLDAMTARIDAHIERHAG
jgi:hypothetical protein